MDFSLSSHITEMLLRLADNPSEELAIAVRMVGERLEQGHVCLDLREAAGQDLISPESRKTRVPALEEWRDLLGASGVVGLPGEYRPLILDSHLLYFHRYHAHETKVAEFIRSRRGRYAESLDRKKLRKGFERLFPPRPENSGATDWQKVAAFLVLTGRFTVISGGPGTGKTTAVARILALLLEQDPGRRIHLAAPTGKAAARLQDSLIQARESLPIEPEVMSVFPHRVSTIHRLLGKSRGRMKFGEENRIAADVVIIDEASMVDLPLMAELMAALPERCSLVLLGDRHQLASVQPGAVFADICQGKSHSFSRECAVLAQECGISDLPTGSGDAGSDMLIEFRTNYRFAEDSGIGLLSRLIKEGREDDCLEFLLTETKGGVDWQNLDLFADSAAPGELVFRQAEHFKRLTTIVDPAEALCETGRTVMLCGLRRGPFGALSINRLVEKSMGVDQPDTFYHGRPIMVLKNNYRKEFYNGDTGIVCRNPLGEGELRCFFPERPNGVSPFILPEHETAYAITVHKSQGSEYDHVVLVLSNTDSPVLTRELFYTGITRARRSVEIWSSPEVLRETIRKKITRSSGLADRLKPTE